MRDHEVFDAAADGYQRMVGAARRAAGCGRALAAARRSTIAAAMLLRRGQVDAALCGGWATGRASSQYMLPIIPRAPGVSRIYSLSA